MLDVLGEDYISHVSLSQLIGERLPVTLELTLLSMALALAVGIQLGVVSATGGRFRRLAAIGCRRYLPRNFRKTIARQSG